MRAFLLSFALFSFTAAASMAPVQETPIDAIISALAGSKTEPQQQTLTLAKFAAGALSVKSVTTMMGGKPESTPLSNVKGAIEENLLTRPWEQKIPAQEEAFIAKNRQFMMNTFGAQSFAWAWMLFQIGEKDQAKALLLARFESEYKRVMKMEEQMMFGGNPMREAEAIATAVKSQVTITPKQKQSMDKKMREMKAHVSQLPDSGIVT